MSSLLDFGFDHSRICGSAVSPRGYGLTSPQSVSTEEGVWRGAFVLSERLLRLHATAFQICQDHCRRFKFWSLRENGPNSEPLSGPQKNDFWSCRILNSFSPETINDLRSRHSCSLLFEFVASSALQIQRESRPNAFDGTRLQRAASS